MMRLLVLLVLIPLALPADNWPQWRGPSANGISTETDLPVRWSATENIAWKAPLKGMGTSTPIVWDDRIFVTSQLGDGPDAGGRDFENAQTAKNTGTGGGVQFLVRAFARSDGRVLWEQVFDAGEHLPAVHLKHNLASPSCVTDGERVYAWFGTGLTAALTLDGELLWKRHLGEERTAFDIRWGHGSSPALYDDAVLLLVDHPDDSYLLAVDRKTGKDLWKVERGKGKRSYTTPFILRRDAGDQLIINTSDRIEAIEPKTGKLLWHVGEANRVPVPMPVYHDGILYSSRGYNSGPYMAVGVDGSGDVTESKLKWRTPTGAPYVSSLLLEQGVIYMANEMGIGTAVDAETGETLWKHRFGGVFSASPVAAAGKIYLTEESGKTFVLEAGRELKIIAENDIGERTLASLALSDGYIFMRTDDHLFAVRQP